MSNFVEFKNGYRYISDKIHQKGRNIKNEPVLVLLPVDKKKYTESFKGIKNYPTYVRTGVRSSGQLVNLMQGRLNEYEYYIIDKTRQVVMKSPNSNFWFAPYLLTLPKGKDTFTNDYLDKQISKVNPIIISKEFMEREKTMITPDNVFSLGIPLNSYIYYYVENHLTGSNSTTTFTSGFKSATLKNSDIEIRKNNSYVEKYYPLVSKIYDNLYGKNLSVIDLETYTNIINTFSKIPHLKGKSDTDLKDKVNALQKNTMKTDFISKMIKQSEIKSYDWNELLHNTLVYDTICGLKIKYYTPDLVTFIDEEVSKEYSKELMDEIFGIISNKFYDKTGKDITKEDVAKSPNGYAYLIIALNQLLK